MQSLDLIVFETWYLFLETRFSLCMLTAPLLLQYQGSANCEMWNMRAKKLMHELNFSSWQEIVLSFTCKSSWSLSFVLLLGDLTTTDFSCYGLQAKTHGSTDSWSFGKELSVYRNGKAPCLVHIHTLMCRTNISNWLKEHLLKLQA